MKTKVTSVRLSRQQVEYLVHASFLGQREAEALRGVEWVGESDAVLELARDRAEGFRDAFTEQLAKVGFDEDYAPTEEGRFLEDLIDLFYVA